MPKFKVKVTVSAERTYEVEVDERDWRTAEAAAAGMWRTETGDDFQVDKVQVDDIISEQLTADCPECGKEHRIPTADSPRGVEPEAWHEDYEVCAACGVLLDAKEASGAK